ncbi:MAG: DUF192 domain-containing protein [Patescibacteria group bacterium]
MVTKKSQFFVLAVTAILLLSFIVFWKVNQKDIGLSELAGEGDVKNSVELDIGHSHLTVMIADIPALQIKGLGGRDFLADDQGMLFIFKDLAYPSIWMKDMHFPIDILWFNDEKKVVSVEKNVATSTYPKIYTPKLPARYVLETNAGFFEKNNLKIGSEIYFSKEVAK